MFQLDAYLFFDGKCAEAMRFYEKTLNGKMEMMMTQSDAPKEAQMPPGDGVLHACLVVQGRMLMASDWLSGTPYPGMSGFSVSLSYPTVAEAQKIFDALAKGGEVRMPFQKTFWSEGFGMLADRFGTPWMVSGEQAAS